MAATAAGGFRRWFGTGKSLSFVRPFTTSATESSMIFAEMEYQEEYWEFHSKLNEHLSAHFHHLKSGIQGDSWFWVYDGEQKVAIDTFSSMKHQVKASVASPLVESVIKTLQLKFRVKVFPEPELEAHEDV